MIIKLFSNYLIRFLKIVTITISVSALAACNSGGSGSSGSNPNPSVTLIPLAIDIRDLNNNIIPYVDVSLFGSHLLYKTTFTNTNSVAVTPPSSNFQYYTPNDNSSFLDQNWMANNNESNPGTGSVSINFIKTNNADDCFSMESISPGSSCSYYTYAYNAGTNFTNESMFSYPLAYIIYTPDHANKLVVQQCAYKFGTNPAQYNCVYESAPGYANQFISYKMNPIGGTTNITSDIYGYISNNGEWSYRCDSMTSCGIYAINYNPITNNLILNNTPSRTITLSAGQPDTIYPSLDGSQAWISIYDLTYGYRLINSESPNIVLSNQCFANTESIPCVPNINTTVNGGGAMGLDGSYWWSPDGGNADIYVATQNTFVQTNIPGVGVAQADGTAILAYGGIGEFAACFRKGNGYTNYTKQIMANYVSTYMDGPYYATSGSYNYLKMPVPNLVNSQGYGDTIDVYYKIHTENELCEIESDDYVTYTPGATTQYTLFGSGTIGTAYVIPISQIYQGL